jgi:F-type H+-transporting ATPase subunit b
MQIESNVALISINATLVFQLVSFLIFLFIINRIMFRPLEQVKGTRDAHLDELREAIKQAEQQVEQMMDVLTREELKAKDEAFERQRILEEETLKQVKQIHDEVKSEIDTLKIENRRKIEEQIEDVKQHLPNEVHKVARTIMEKALERRLVDETV